MTGVDLRDISFYVMFVVLYFLVPWLVIEMTYSEKYRLDLSELWLFKGRLDKFAVMVVVAWWVHTASMILWTLAQKVQTQDYLAYAGVWVSPILIKMIGQAFGSNGGGRAPPSDVNQLKE